MNGGSLALDSDFYTNPNSSMNSLNPRQIFWIKKRKMRREALDSVMKSNRTNYIHESRHRHAMKRLRAPTGRFLTKEEMYELKKTQ